MKRPPFKIEGHTSATYVRDGRHITSGRTSFVWKQLVLAIASGVPGEHKIMRTRPSGPWHIIDLTVEEAEAALDPNDDFFGKRRVARARRYRAAREVRAEMLAAQRRVRRGAL